MPSLHHGKLIIVSRA